MTVDEMREEKKKCGYTYQMLSEASGLPAGSIQKIFCGVIAQPRFKTMISLENAFRSLRHSCENDLDKVPFPEGTEEHRGTPVLRESSVSSAWKNGSSGDMKHDFFDSGRQGSYTVKDYLQLPEDCRAELIDGAFYDMATPSFLHQRIIARVYYRFQQYIDEKGGNCIPCPAPVSVQLTEDERNMFEPDLIVLCDRSKLKEPDGIIGGAPDFVMEVLSPSTRDKDLFRKTPRYKESGVRELWIVDPKNRKVIVYEFGEGADIPAIYGFDAIIPVGIYGGDLKIDFGSILKENEFLFPAP